MTISLVTAVSEVSRSDLIAKITKNTGLSTEKTSTLVDALIPTTISHLVVVNEEKGIDAALALLSTDSMESHWPSFDRTSVTHHLMTEYGANYEQSNFAINETITATKASVTSLLTTHSLAELLKVQNGFLSGKLPAWASTVTGMVSKTGLTILATGTAVAGGAVAVVSNLSSNIGEKTSNLVEGMSDKADSLLNGLNNTADTVIQTTADITHHVVDKASDVVDVVSDKASNLFSGLKGAVTGTVDGAENLATKAVDGVKSGAEHVVDGAEHLGSKAVEGTTDAVKGVATGVSNTTGAVVGGAVAVGAGLAGMAGGLFGKATDTVKGAVNTTTDAVTHVAGGATDLAGKAVDGTTDAVKSVANGVGNTAGAVVGGVTAVGAGLAGMAGGLLGKATDTVGSAVDATTNVAKDVAQGVGSTAGAVVGGATDLAGKAVDGTANLAKGVANGVGNTAGAVVGGVTAVGAGLAGLASKAGHSVADTTSKVAHGASNAGAHAVHTATEAVKEPAGFFRKFLPLLALIVLALLALLFWQSCKNKPVTPVAPTETVVTESTVSTAVPVALLPSTLSIETDGVKIKSATAVVGSEELKTQLTDAFKATYGADAVINVTVDPKHDTTFPSLAQLPALLTELKANPNGALSLSGKDVVVTGSEAFLAKVQGLYTPESGVTVTGNAAAIEAKIQGGATAALEALNKLTPATTTAGELASALNLQIINFATGSAHIPEVNKAVLTKASELLKAVPALRLVVAGNTDNVGFESKNQRLSLSRAKSVQAFLVANGATKDQLEVKGNGSSMPKADNTTAEGRFTNRRIEFSAADGVTPVAEVAVPATSTTTAPTTVPTETVVTTEAVVTPAQ